MAVEAVVLDLFGTLVAAPTPRERTHAAARLASVVGCDTATALRYLRDSWGVRHDGKLPTLSALAKHLVDATDGSGELSESVADELKALAQTRLAAEQSVVFTLRSLRRAGLRIGILSDASAEVVAVWPTSPIADLVDAVAFSCEVGAVKPDRRLYDHIRHELGVPTDQVLYVGDGGGDELRGATAAGIGALAVRRRGSRDAMAFGAADWSGPTLEAVEHLPDYIAELP